MTWPLRKKYLVVSQKLKIPLPYLLSIVLTGIYPREIQIRFVQKYIHKCLLQLVFFFFFLVVAKTRKNLELFPTFICNCTVFGGWLSVLEAGRSDFKSQDSHVLATWLWQGGTPHPDWGGDGCNQGRLLRRGGL